MTTEVEILPASLQLIVFDLEFFNFKISFDLFQRTRKFMVKDIMTGECIRANFNSYEEAKNYCEEMEYSIGD